MTYVTDAEVIKAIRVMCTSPVYADSDQRVRCILATIEAHQPDDYPAATAEVPTGLALPRNAHGGLDLAALDAQVGLAPSAHIIEMSEDMENERSYWQCDCGRSGSCDSYNVDIAAEKHVPAGEHIVYRHPGGAR